MARIFLVVPDAPVEDVAQLKSSRTLGKSGIRLANRKFKPPFSLSATISPARQAVNRAVFGENLALSMIIRTPHRPGAAHFDAV